jgi:hypothetical protein
MENITRAAFDVQYGLFKVSVFFWVDVIAAVMAIIFLCKVLKSASRL